MDKDAIMGYLKQGNKKVLAALLLVLLATSVLFFFLTYNKKLNNSGEENNYYVNNPQKLNQDIEDGKCSEVSSQAENEASKVIDNDTKYVLLKAVVDCKIALNYPRDQVLNSINNLLEVGSNQDDVEYYNILKQSIEQEKLIEAQEVEDIDDEELINEPIAL